MRLVSWSKPYFQEGRICLGRWYWRKNKDIIYGGKEISFWLYVEPRDIWIGLYFDKDVINFIRYFYFCLIPCIPLRIIYRSIEEIKRKQ